MVTIANFREDQYPEVSGTRCIKIYIPDDDTFKSLAAGLLSLASYESSYVGNEPEKAATLAQQWRDAYLQSDWNECEVTVTIPIGAIMQYAAGLAPTGWLLCNGNEVLKADYPDLWNAITDLWGTATLGSDYFVLPDFRDKSPFGYHDGGGATKLFGHYYGAETHTLTEAQMPAHAHEQAWFSGGSQVAAGGGYNFQGIPSGVNTSSKGGGQAHNNLHPVGVCSFIIYAGGG